MQMKKEKGKICEYKMDSQIKMMRDGGRKKRGDMQALSKSVRLWELNTQNAHAVHCKEPRVKWVGEGERKSKLKSTGMNGMRLHTYTCEARIEKNK